jgi:hypothetical protein
VRGYNHSSHGWFFWNWHDHVFYDKWDMEQGVLGRGRLPQPLAQLAAEFAQEEWVRDPWVIPSSVAGSSASAFVVSWFGRMVANPLVGGWEGGTAWGEGGREGSYQEGGVERGWRVREQVRAKSTRSCPLLVNPQSSTLTVNPLNPPPSTFHPSAGLYDGGAFSLLRQLGFR